MAYKLEEDPSNLQEALSSLDADLWREAINNEMDYTFSSIEIMHEKFNSIIAS